MSNLHRSAVAAAAALSALAFAGPAQAADSYRIDGVRTQAQRSAVARSGAAIVQVNRRSVVVTASRTDLRALRRAGFKPRARARAADFPAADSGYHNYSETNADTLAVATAHPDIVTRFSLG